MRSEAEQTDEGRGAAAILLKPQSDLPVLPGPHQSRLRRASFPQMRINSRNRKKDDKRRKKRDSKV